MAVFNRGEIGALESIKYHAGKTHVDSSKLPASRENLGSSSQSGAPKRDVSQNLSEGGHQSNLDYTRWQQSQHPELIYRQQVYDVSGLPMDQQEGRARSPIERSVLQAESSEVTRAPETRKMTAAALYKSFMSCVQKMYCCGDSEQDTKTSSNETRRGLQQRDTGVSHPIHEIPLNHQKYEMLLDAQMNIWEGRLNEEEVVHLMKTDQVHTSENLPASVGATRPEKITLNCGLVCIFKSASKNNGLDSYKSEIEAYQLNKLLGLEFVCLTVEREINGVKGSLQLWVKDLELPQQGQQMPDDAKFFDKLITQVDRGRKNWGWRSGRVVLFDHASAFPPIIDRIDEDESHLKPSPGVLEKARELDENKLEQHIMYLDVFQKEELLDRRDKLLRAINKG